MDYDCLLLDQSIDTNQTIPTSQDDDPLVAEVGKTIDF